MKPTIHYRRIGQHVTWETLEALTRMVLILIGTGIVGAALLGVALQTRAPRLRGIARGLLVSYVTMMILLGAGELYFRFVYAAPEGQRARENWMARYWQTNALGYRDAEVTPERYKGKKTVLVLGDSFAAGWGIPDTADRFSDVLGHKLGSEYAVFNLGVPGAATRSELRNLRDFPITNPNVVILQYFLNDIEDAALSVGQFQTPPRLPDWARESYLGNFIYSLNDTGFGPTYWEWEYARYNDTNGVWNVHRQELIDFAVYARGVGARLIVVIFPNMQDPVGSIPYVDRVAQVFEEQGVTDILKLFDAVAAWQPSQVVISARDAHPSQEFHRYVGEQIYDLFFASGR